MFYDRLKKICEESGTNMTALSKKLKFSSGNISKWKNGGVPKGETLMLIAEELSISSDYLLGLDDKPNRNAQLSADKRRLLEMYDKLTDMEKGEILGELKMLTGDFPMTAAARSTDNSMPTKPNIDNLDDFPTMDEE